MQLASIASPARSVAPIAWDEGARRGAQHLPTDSTVDVQAFRRSLSWGAAYEFTGGIAQALHGVEVLVERGGSMDPVEVLARIDRQLAELPEAAIARLRQIIVYRTQDTAYDRAWERAYRIPGFQAVAAGGGGQVTFFGGKPYTDGVLFHEVGHNLPVNGSAWNDAMRSDDRTIAALVATGTLRPVAFEDVPDEVRRLRWTPRLAPGGITPYADGRPGEDIAEALRMLMSERHRGHAFAELVDALGGVRQLTFSEAYPARTRVLEVAANADLDGDGDIGQ
jgi:hypothetical protein